MICFFCCFVVKLDAIGHDVMGLLMIEGAGTATYAIRFSCACARAREGGAGVGRFCFIEESGKKKWFQLACGAALRLRRQSYFALEAVCSPRPPFFFFFQSRAPTVLL